MELQVPVVLEEQVPFSPPVTDRAIIFQNLFGTGVAKGQQSAL